MSSGKKQGHDSAIDDHLKRVFDETLEEGIPERFQNLLRQLKEQDAEKGSKK